ncbi:MAG: hypothetical protein HY815_12455 [Candidatus Riflebacteria bacterium]|nr:hypothetical protein [Candidatus Riflebacteria bacterium]
MDELAVVNASPLILLGRAGLTEILKEAGARIVVPEAVADEVLRRGATDPVARFVRVT